MQYRNVTCMSHDSNSICTADERFKPMDRRPCNSTCGQWFVSHWSENVSFSRQSFSLLNNLEKLIHYFFCKCMGPCDNATLVRRVWCNSSICNQDQRPFSTRRCIPAHCANQSIYKNQTTTSTQLMTTKTTSKIAKLTSATISIKKLTTTSARTYPFTVAKKTTTTTTRRVKLTTKTSSRRGWIKCQEHFNICFLNKYNERRCFILMKEYLVTNENENKWTSFQLTEVFLLNLTF